MTWKIFEKHMKECGVFVFDNHMNSPQVVIRTADGDCELAACHRSTDGKTLILDLGQPITARGLEVES